MSRNYHLRGRILQVPSNYNPQTGNTAVSGTERLSQHTAKHGLVSVGYADPSRYGMGKRLGAAMWKMGAVLSASTATSRAGRFGGTEPRITCNALTTSEAWDVLSDFCSRCAVCRYGTGRADVRAGPTSIRCGL
ncbi:putative host specificity protein J [Escherichia coli p0305293.11]|nr:putative host specificity protein J [Escherichia coli p0305293.11]